MPSSAESSHQDSKEPSHGKSSSDFPTLKLLKSKSHLAASRHPWVLDSSIQNPTMAADMGDTVTVVTNDDRFIGYGIYNPDSRIRCRLYSWNRDIVPDESMVESRLRDAISLRFCNLQKGSDNSAIRICFSEADRLSGVIIDKFADHLVVQITAAAMLRFIDVIQDILEKELKPNSITLLIDRSTADVEGLDESRELLFGQTPTEPISIKENGLKWLVDLRAGQKTGWYLDQSQNRFSAAEWIAPNSRLLDVCCYTGGFAITAASRKKLQSVTAIDSSLTALEIAQSNAELNQTAVSDSKAIDWVQADAFDFLKNTANNAPHSYDAIILDPPKLAGSRHKMQPALRAYHRLNYDAIQCLRPGGILITCSCSGRVTTADFSDVLLGVSKRSQREIQILEQRTAAPDHPSIVTCPETNYLKCFICRVL